jgi:predicted tellurium resistance membrane protein TerC
MLQLFTTENLVAVVTLTALEVVLGIDNVVFLSILTSRLPPAERPRARRIGLALAMGARIGLLLGITWVMGLTATLLTVAGHDISGKDLILLGGGLFLIAKSTHEIHGKMEHGEGEAAPAGRNGSFVTTVAQIVVVDLVFSLDSVITAVGMVNTAHAAPPGGAVAGAHHGGMAVMVTAVVLAVLMMMAYAGAIGDFVERHPTIKMLALSFLILIGVMLVAEGLGQHMDKGYIYFAMAFSLGVELLNMRLRRRAAARREAAREAAAP